MAEWNEDGQARRRDLLRTIFAETMVAIRVRDVFRRMLRCANGRLQIDHLSFDLTSFRRVLIIAIGKAAVPSVEAIVEQVNPCLPESCSLHAVVVGPGELVAERCEVRRWPGSHPVPDESAREAAIGIVEALQGAGPRDLVLFLISGGASAMVELPLDTSLTVGEIAEFYRALVQSGLKIAEMNTLRKHLSAVKGGRLAAFAKDATLCTLLISDVPEGMPDVIGSGPTLPDTSTREQCWELLRRTEVRERLPQQVRAFLERVDLPETPKPHDACFARSKFHIALSTTVMLREAARLCEQYGFHTVIDNSCDDWEYRKTADYLLGRVEALANEHECICLLSGGEVLVRLDAEPGQGGRNQQFALYCATRLAEFTASTTEITVLSAGTDGIDGNSPAAGAVTDRTTMERAQRAGLSVTDAIQRFDSYSLLQRIGDAIVTGPSGNNVRDLRILMAVRRLTT